MGRHAGGPPPARRPILIPFALVTALVIVASVLVVLWGAAGGPDGLRGTDALDGSPAPTCDTTVRVVTATSFAPVLAALDPTLRSGRPCANLDVTVADGRAAAERVAALDAHLWIPDDGAWVGVGTVDQLGLTGSGTVLATSPFYLVTDEPTARQVAGAGGSWLGLAGLTTGGTTRLALRDPGASGDGLIAAGAIGEAVWLDAGMDASAQVLAAVLPRTRTVTGAAPALPRDPGEVGLVPEYALPADGLGPGLVALAPTDHTAQLRFTWLPTARGGGDPTIAAALWRALQLFHGPAAAAALAASGLRSALPLSTDPTVATATATATAAATAGAGAGPSAAEPGVLAAPAGSGVALDPALPTVSAPPFGVLAPHHVEHVFATWYPRDRRSDVLLVVDVSGSMAGAAPGGDTPLIDVVRDGCTQLGALLPDDSELGLWEFGSSLDPPRDHRVLLPRGPLGAGQRQAFATVTAGLAAQRTGTGLYDTLLAAYTAARDDHRPGVPNHVLLFTDGRNGDDPGSLTAAQLGAALGAALDPARPVRLTVVTFGPEPEAELLTQVLGPIGGYVDPVDTADEVRAVFIHVAAGGLHTG